MTARRILICLHDFHRGGTERVALDLAARWAAAGHAVTILCGAETGGLRDAVDPRVPVMPLDPPLRRGLLSRPRLGAAMGRHLPALKPDVIFLPGNFHLPLARGLRRADPHPVIVCKVSNPPLPQGCAAIPVAPLFRWFARAVDGFAAMNGGLARDVAALAPQARVATLYDPMQVGAAPAGPHRPEIRNILWVGRLEAQKDVALALAAFRVLLARGPARLTILGDGGQRPLVEKAAADLGGHLDFPGYVADIAPYLARASALLVTSRYEGGPAVAVEALALGTPVVATDCSHLLREIMTAREAGRIVPSRDPAALAAALEDVCAAPRPPGETLAALVTGFAPDRCARAYLDWFDALAAARSAATRS